MGRSRLASPLVCLLLVSTQHLGWCPFHCNLISQWVLERNLDWRVTERFIPKMKTPTLIVWGKQDNLLLPNLYLPRWHQLAPHATIVEIDQSGHLTYEDQPEQVSQVLLSFLAS